MLRTSLKFFPRLQVILRDKTGRSLKKAHLPLVSVRFFNDRRYDPFSQMEHFIRDMEKKFWGEVGHNFPWFSSPCSSGSRFGFPSWSRDVPSTHSRGVGGPTDLSTAEKFKYAFNFPNAKPDDIKVTLKDRVITVEAKVEESTENSKVNQSFYYQYTLPESVDVEALESILSHDGVLTIEAPQTPSEKPQTINIKRE